jgi:hypothetical protein
MDHDRSRFSSAGANTSSKRAVVDREPVSQRMQLDAGRTRVEAADGFAERVVSRIDAPRHVVERISAASVGPVHHDDYGVFRSPLSAFVTQMRRRGLAGRLRTIGPGDTVPLLCTPEAGPPA